MWKNKEIKDVSASSVVELKAELFKASEQFQRERQRMDGMPTKRIVTDGKKIQESLF